MIYGIGTDLVKVERIAATYARFGERFVRHLLTGRELADFQRARDPVRFLAMRFAAKEAIVKAMGTGFRQGMWLRDVGVYQEPSGKPVVELSEKARHKCAINGAGQAHITLTDEAGMVVAVAVIERA